MTTQTSKDAEQVRQATREAAELRRKIREEAKHVERVFDTAIERLKNIADAEHGKTWEADDE